MRIEVFVINKYNSIRFPFVTVPLIFLNLFADYDTFPPPKTRFFDELGCKSLIIVAKVG